MNGNQYFLLNEEEDFIRQGNWFCSGLLDSGEKQTEWNRLKVVTGKKPRLWIFVSEQKTYMEAGQKKDLEQLIQNPLIEMEQKIKLFLSFPSLSIRNQTDVLLKDIRGRYLWLAGEADAFEITGEIQIFFQSAAWISFLPEVYQGREEQKKFLSEYLGIFQWIYYDMTEKIASMPHRLYPVHADMDFLRQIAEWFAIENIEIWNRKQIIYLIENGRRLSEIRGTKEYMQEMVWLFTGHRPYIVEYYQTKPYRTNLEKIRTLERLYGEHAYMVTILLPPETIRNRQQIAVLQRMIRFAAPAYIECRLVVLESCIYLDGYSYIGLNSYLGGYQNMQLNHSRLTPYRSIVGNKQ